MSIPKLRVLAISMITNVAQEEIDQSAEQQANHTEGLYQRFLLIFPSSVTSKISTEK